MTNMTTLSMPKFPQLIVRYNCVQAAIAIDMSGSLTLKGMVAIKESIKVLVNELQSQQIKFEFTLWAFDNFVHFDSIQKLSNFDNHIVEEKEIEDKIDCIFKFGRGGSSLDESFYFIKAINLDVTTLIFITDGVVENKPECPTLDEIEKHIFLLADTKDQHEFINVKFDYKLSEIFI